MTAAGFENFASAPLVPLWSTIGFAVPAESDMSTSALGQRVLRNLPPRQQAEGQSVLDIDIALFVHVNPSAIMGRTLFEKAFLNALFSEGKGTAAPQALYICWSSLETRSRAIKPRVETTAQELVENIRKKSGLTLEEIAPLVGVSRRSLQNWRAGGTISARKEQRLRDIADTFESLGHKNPRSLRRLIFERANHGVRAYDLLAERQFGAAYSAVTGQAAPDHLVTRSWTAALSPAPSLLARLSIRDDGPSGTTGRVDLRRSRRLKR